MKVLIGVHHFPPVYRGGAEWRAHRLASALQEAGHEASVICVERIDDAQAAPLAYADEVFEGVAVRRLSFDLGAAPDPLHWEYDNLWVGEHLRQVFDERKPDLFHLIGGYLLTGSALRAAQQAGLPTVVTLTDFWFLCRRFSMLRTDGAISTLPIDPLRCARCLGEEKRRFRWLGKLAPGLMTHYWRQEGRNVNYFTQRRDDLTQLLAATDLAIAPSRFLRDFYIQAGMTARRMEFLRQGHKFGHLPRHTLIKTPAGRLRIGYLGQLAPLKGVHVLIDAVRSLPSLPVDLFLYGDSQLHSAYSAKLQSQADGDERIHLMGQYERRQLTSILCNLDVTVVPSLWYENSPNVILEAFAHDTPVIAANFGGMAELVEDESNGLHFAVGNASDLARQLQRLVEDSTLLPRLTEGAVKTSTPTVAEEMTKILALYQSLL
ncbi:glycosyltransferase family 4 protein [Caldilinea sp.]|uniref:glycosyltransferase family 4 protein n=1 Tax=Caldilinea sp. TaxID=2293560 RepID=UPI002B60966E|nr:glycosyltransferase family 4 protein [Caldilinea sp.]